jgi:hypothetical protein
MVLFFCACTQSVDSADSPVDTPDCDIVISNTWPADGAVGVYNRDPIEFTLTSPAPNAQFVADFAGTQSVSADGLVITYTPDQPLEPQTRYTVALDYCYSTPEISFTTSSLGEPLMDDVSMLGMAWVIDPSDGEYLEGAGLAGTMTAVFDRALVTEVINSSGSEMAWRLGISDELGQKQDECFRTIEVEDVDFSEAPYFEFSAPEINIDAYDDELTFYDINMDGTISSDGEMLGGVRYSFTIDIAELVLVMNVSDTETLCEHAATLGSTCGPCPRGGDDTCTTLVARGLIGEPSQAPVVYVEENNSKDCL